MILGTRKLLCFGHGCSGSPYGLETRTLLWLEHGCSGDRTPWNTNGIMEFGMNAVGTRTQRGRMLSWSPHGCSAKNAMRGGSSNFEASEGPKARFLPSRPVPMGTGGNAFFER